MAQQTQLTIRLEIIWWIITLIVLFGVLYPIYNATNDYPFLLINTVFIIIFITFTRYVFLLKYTFLAHQRKFKMLLIVLSVPLIFYLINGINFFQTYLDENGVESFLKNDSIEQINTTGTYIRNELMFFGIGSLFIAVALPVRMIISIWREINKGTV